MTFKLPAPIAPDAPNVHIEDWIAAKATAPAAPVKTPVPLADDEGLRRLFAAHDVPYPHVDAPAKPGASAAVVPLTRRQRKAARKAAKLKASPYTPKVTFDGEGRVVALPEGYQGSLKVTTPPADDLALRELYAIHTYRRVHGSATEQAFIDRFVVPLGFAPDDFGNYWLEIADDAGEVPAVLFTAHTDTVHRYAGRQSVSVDGGWLYVRRAKDNNCLGADDGAGIWLLREMIKAGKPGRYVLYRDEEAGGNGSSWSARHEPHRYDGVQVAIAFDRKGTRDIITDQAGGMCASDGFAYSLADALAEAGLGGYKPDPTGVFTDTANLTGIVPECTNVSVGYEQAHGPAESLDLMHVQALRDALLKLDLQALEIKRKPGDDGFAGGAYGGGFTTYRDQSQYAGRYDWSGGYVSRKDDDCQTLEGFVYSHPKTVADYLLSQGVTLDDLQQWRDMADDGYGPIY